MTTASTLQPETMPKRTHTTLSEHRIEYDPSPTLAAFLTRLEDMISNPKVSEQDMIGIAYSRENPLLDHTMHPARAMVTKEVLDDPAYAVMSDLLFRKRVAQEKVDVAKIAAKYTMTVKQAAEELGMHPSAIRQAIEARRLASWMRDGAHHLEPRAVEAFKETLGERKRGPKAKAEAHELDIVLGHGNGQSLRVRAPGDGVHTVERLDGNIVRGRIVKWHRVVVLTTRGTNKRAFVLEPAEVDSEITHGPFSVRGRFTIVEKANATKTAGEIWNEAEVR